MRQVDDQSEGSGGEVSVPDVPATPVVTEPSVTPLAAPDNTIRVLAIVIAIVFVATIICNF